MDEGDGGAGMSPATLKVALAGALLLLLATAGGVWKVQDWRYGKQLAEQSGAHQADLTAISNAAAAQVRADQDKRLSARAAPGGQRPNPPRGFDQCSKRPSSPARSPCHF